MTYWGLVYKVIRYVGVSPNEPYKNNVGVKIGSWFMRYELEQKLSAKEIKKEYSWGTFEQWIYNNQGYVYFFNGNITI